MARARSSFVAAVHRRDGAIHLGERDVRSARSHRSSAAASRPRSKAPCRAPRPALDRRRHEGPFLRARRAGTEREVGAPSRLCAIQATGSRPRADWGTECGDGADIGLSSPLSEGVRPLVATTILASPGMKRLLRRSRWSRPRPRRCTRRRHRASPEPRPVALLRPTRTRSVFPHTRCRQRYVYLSAATSRRPRPRPWRSARTAKGSGWGRSNPGRHAGRGERVAETQAGERCQRRRGGVAVAVRRNDRAAPRGGGRRPRDGSLGVGVVPHCETACGLVEDEEAMQRLPQGEHEARRARRRGGEIEDGADLNCATRQRAGHSQASRLGVITIEMNEGAEGPASASTCPASGDKRETTIVRSSRIRPGAGRRADLTDPVGMTTSVVSDRPGRLDGSAWRA